jgi:flagellar motor switch protein FliM
MGFNSAFKGLINTSFSNIASDFAFISPSPSSLPNEIFVFSSIEVWTVKEVERDFSLCTPSRLIKGVDI